MKVLFKPSEYTIGRYRCVAIDKNEKMLSGRRGWIFEANKLGTRLVVVTVTSGGNEKIIYCDFDQLEKQILRIRFLGNLEKGAYYANNPNARHDK